MIAKNGRDIAIEDLTPEDYIVPKGEERLYHVAIETRQFDPRSGKRLSRARIQKFGRKMYETHVRASLQKQGYTITELHNPSAWIAAHAAQAAASRKAKAEADKKAFDEAVSAAVERALAAEREKAAKKAKKAQKATEATEGISEAK